MSYSLTIPFLLASGTGSHKTMMLVALVLCPVMFCGGRLGAKRKKQEANILKIKKTMNCS